jgi:hypothetical protein
VLLGLIAASVIALAPDTALYQKALSAHVTNDGRVRYAALRADLGALDEFVAQIGRVSPDSHPALFPSRESRLAYWLNAYNAIVLWAFAKDYPEGRTRLRNKLGQAKFFFVTKFPVGGTKRSLDDIETNSVRKVFGDPRIHFALVCASASCPWLSRTAFSDTNVDAELDRLSRQFIGQERNVSIDEKTGLLRLSMIFKWYEKDFGGRQRMLAFLERYRDFGGTELRKLRLQFVEYDWSLNEAEEASKRTTGQPPHRPAN